MPATLPAKSTPDDLPEGFHVQGEQPAAADWPAAADASLLDRLASLGDALKAYGYQPEPDASPLDRIVNLTDEGRARLLGCIWRDIDRDVLAAGLDQAERSATQDGCCNQWTPEDGCRHGTGRLAMSLAERELDSEPDEDADL